MVERVFAATSSQLSHAERAPFDTGEKLVQGTRLFQARLLGFNKHLHAWNRFYRLVREFAWR